MKNAKQLIALIMVLFTLSLGCNKEDDNIAQIPDPQQEDPDGGEDPDDGEDPVGGEFVMADVQVIVPDGAAVDISTTTLFTLANAVTVDAGGKATVPFNVGTSEIAYLLDAENNLLLAGFLTDDRKEVSISTTTEVMLFFGMASSLRGSAYKDFFVKEARNISGFNELVTGIQNLFLDNALMFTEGTYTTLISDKIEEITASEVIDLESKIDLGSGIARSGLDLIDQGDKTFAVNNSYPRRTHAYVYKKSFKDDAGNETILNPDISGNDSADKDLRIPFVTLQSETTTEGDVFNYSLCTQGSRYLTKTSENIELVLLENQASAIYEISVVGPGNGTTPGRQFTTAEQSKFDDLSVETFILDYFLPILLDMGGNRAMLAGVADSELVPLVNVVEPILRAHQPSLDAVLANDFRTALDEFLPFLYGDIRLSNDLREILKGVYTIISDGGSNPNTFVQSNELVQEGELRYLKVITSIIIGFKASVGLNCINQRLANSNPLESWEVKVSDGNVKLSPEQLSAIPFGPFKEVSVETTVELENGDQLEYEWSTTGQFGGSLNDQNGQTGASIITNQSKVLYRSTASANQLSDGNNIEQLIVKASIRNGATVQEVGSDTLDVNVRKNKFFIRPNGVTISGDQSVTLRLRNKLTSIPNADTDFIVVWTTPGSYGLFDGISTNVTKDNNNSIVYKAMDEEVEEGTEKFRALIYGRPKNTNLSYRLVDDVAAEINIENDPLQKIFLVKKPTIVGIPPAVDDDGIFCTWSVQASYRFKPLDPALLALENKEVVEYKLIIKEAIPDAIPSYVGSGTTWLAENEAADLNTQGQYVYRYSATGSQGGASGCSSSGTQEAYDNVLEIYNTFEGYAQVVATLKFKD